SVPHNDARAMRAVAVLVRGVGQSAIIKERRHPAREVGMHSGCVARVQAAVSDRHRYARARVTKIVDVARAFAAQTPDDVRRDLIEQFHLRGGLDPEYAVGLRKLLELA